MSGRVLVLLAAACGGAPITEAPSPGAPTVVQERTVDEVDEAEIEPPVLVPPTTGRWAATELRVAWRGATGAPAHVARTEDEARARAASLHARALAGEDLAELARHASDAPSAGRGGALGTFPAQTYAPGLEAAVAAVAPGEIAPLVRTEAGWHVLRRELVDEVVVVWAAWGVDGRSPSEALASATAAATALAAGALPSGVDADATSPDVGVLLGRDQWDPALEAAAFGLAPGEVTGPLETPRGIVVIRRPPAISPPALPPPPRGSPRR